MFFAEKILYEQQKIRTAIERKKRVLNRIYWGVPIAIVLIFIAGRSAVVIYQMYHPPVVNDGGRPGFFTPRPQWPTHERPRSTT